MESWEKLFRFSKKFNIYLACSINKYICLCAYFALSKAYTLKKVKWIYIKIVKIVIRIYIINSKLFINY